MGRPCSSTSVQGGTKSTRRKKGSVRTVVDGDFLAEPDLPVALTGPNMLVETLGGRSYTESEHQAALAAAGFATSAPCRWR